MAEVATAAPASTSGTGTPRRSPAWQVAGACAVLVALYAAVIAAGDHRAWSGSDPGGKLATIQGMDRNGLADPDVGYWAEAWDPEGVVHPLLNTSRGAERWTQATPLLYAAPAVPLHRLAGIPGVLALGVAAGVAAALGARALARALGDPTGWPAFWLVGAGSVVLHYVGDTWEHLPALAAALVGVGLLARAPLRWPRALAGGAALGVAVALRREVLLWVVALAVAVVLVRSLRSAWSAATAAVAGGTLAVVVVGTSLVESGWAGPSAPVDRSGDQLAGALEGLGSRVEGAWLTTLAVRAGTGGADVLAGLLLAAGLVVLGVAATRASGRVPSRLWQVGAALSALGYLARILPGLLFVPGALPTQPAAAGAVGARAGGERAIALAALAPLPVVWLVQWRGGMDIQWGGRLLMVGATLLVVVGSVAVGRCGWRRPAAVCLVVATAVASVLSVAFHVERSHVVATAADAVVARAEPLGPDAVVVTTFPFGREAAGVVDPMARWLEVQVPGDLPVALDVAGSAGAGTVLVVSRAPLEDVPAGWSVVAEDRAPYFRSSELVLTELASGR